MKKIFSLIILSLMSSLFFAQAGTSFMPHLKEVIAIYQDSSTPEKFYTVGKDGYVIIWDSENRGFHYQITDKQIKKTAFNPVKTEAAFYETDENSVNIISVWDLKTFTKKFSILIDDTILSLNYSKKGSYLMAGTATEKGVLFINPASGAIAKGYPDKLLMTSFIETANSEKSIMSYSITGHITYTDSGKGTTLKRITTQSALSKMVLFNKNRFAAGFKDKKIIIIDAVTGKTAFEIAASNPTMYNYNDELYYFDSPASAKNHSLFKFVIEEGKVKNPVIAYNINGKLEGSISDFIITENRIIAGSTKGYIYDCKLDAENNLYVFSPVSYKNLQKIIDAAFGTDDLFILTEKAVYKSDESKEGIIKISENKNYTNITSTIDSDSETKLILWSQNKDSAVSLISTDKNLQSNIFTPTGLIKTLKYCGNTNQNSSLIYIENSSKVNRYNFSKNAVEELYYGSGIQDAVLLNENDLYIAKACTSPLDSPLIYVNTKTHETVQLKFDCDSVYSLAVDNSVKENNQIIYAIGVTDKDGKSQTKIYRFDAESKKVETAALLKGADYTGDLYVNFDFIIHKLCSQQFTSLGVKSKKSLVYKRSLSLPVKAASNSEKCVFVNSDGSMSWVDIKSPELIADWYITDDERVLEY